MNPKDRQVLADLWNKAATVRLHTDSHTRSYVSQRHSHIKGGLGWCSCQSRLSLESSSRIHYVVCEHQLAYARLLIPDCTFEEYELLLRRIVPPGKIPTNELGLKPSQHDQLNYFLKVYEAAKNVYLHTPKKGFLLYVKTADDNGTYFSSDSRCNCESLALLRIESSEALGNFIRICEHSLAVRMHKYPNSWYENISALRF